ncbi:hypothetical protein HPB50_000508 [Hyalomma asiaticum]|uniref:Uncharacterized protein n=1 Tax=Hyalomma asiaticum TaxID=266040 RepID=A0ACB7SZ30_HYAAI|nr:hypothetical protein HPB50_000508 [Hyalomma asiaticum]
MEYAVEGEYLRGRSPRPSDDEDGAQNDDVRAFIGFWPRALVDSEAPDSEQGPWASLPDVLLETVYSMVPIADRYAMSQVCRNWYRVFYSPRVWSVFVLDDRTMTRRKFNYYMGYQHLLDHYRTQICVHKIGRHIRHLLIPAMSNFFNLYEFMVIMAYFGERNNASPLAATSWATTPTARDRKDSVFGTGGKLLESLKRLMCCFTGLRHLALTDLLLEPHEAKFLLDDVAETCMTTLRTLRLVNCSKEPYPFLHAGVFLNLTTLYISPQHLDDDLVTLLSYTSLRDLHLIQTTYTEMGLRVSPRVWRECRRATPRLRVHLSVEGTVAKEIIWQECAPVHSIVYKTAYNQVGPESALTAATYYTEDLRTYAFLGLPRFHMAKRFVDRPDSALVLLCRSCRRLETLVIRERISTATVLLLAYHGRSLRRFVVRGNAVIKKCDWPRNPEWSDEFYAWLRHTAQSYDAVCQEVSQILGFAWAPLTDKQFKTIVLHESGSRDFFPVSPQLSMSDFRFPAAEHRLSFSSSGSFSPI